MGLTQGMSPKPVLTPGPDHPITISPATSRVVVRAGGQVVADTRSALTLHESTYPGVAYIPRADVDLTLLERSETGSYCPYKGEASYFSIPALGEGGKDVVWTYETPYAPVAEIKDYVAFYPNKVDSIEETPLPPS